MSADYSNLGLTRNLKSVNNFSDKVKVLDAYAFDSAYEVQVRKLYTSKANLGEFVRRSVGSSALGTFNLSPALNLTTSITYDSPHNRMKTYGKPIVGIYQGNSTASADEIYPIRGTAVTLGRYDVIGGELDYSNYNGTADQWRAMIVDTNGTSAQAITFIADWIFADYVTGDA